MPTGARDLNLTVASPTGHQPYPAPAGRPRPREGAGTPCRAVAELGCHPPPPPVTFMKDIARHVTVTGHVCVTTLPKRPAPQGPTT